MYIHISFSSRSLASFKYRTTCHDSKVYSSINLKAALVFIIHSDRLNACLNFMIYAFCSPFVQAIEIIWHLGPPVHKVQVIHKQ